ncbi:YjiH family protein [Oceanobacillus halophilus]|uniref:YjiH family protein n=1 Tax=Oceanobacillus halophilus TaxID=930130 RepID=A0A494ZXN9_9BACI|nr:YjiH family protein [Oceanobacillus halophilus]RKQ31525.1 YjiH family protein [Oceanobacillus halophilus]
MKHYSLSDHLKFIIPSLIGIFIFIIPVPTEDGFTIPIALLANAVQGVLTNILSAIMMMIILITAIFTVIAKIGGPKVFQKTPFFQNLFSVHLFWTFTRVLAAIFAVMVFFRIGPEAIYGPDTGQMLLGDLLHVLFAVFLFAGLFLPLLMNFGLLEFIGTITTKIMRPLFKLPGRSSIDALASWVGDGTIGVLLTSKQYEEGFYTKREATVIGTTFSVVSITFSLVVLAEVDLAHMFLPFYLTILIAGFAAALIMPRIPPLSKKADTYLDNQENYTAEAIPDGESTISYGYKNALNRAKKETSVYQFFKEGIQNILDMWLGVAPVVMAFGLVALIIAEYTPFFQWIGAPFIPLLELMQVPYAQEASETILIGFADMFLPAIVGSGIEAEITRFIIAALSVTQLIYMSEVGGLLLGSKVPVTFLDLAIIFLLRTLITLPIITLIAHIIF